MQFEQLWNRSTLIRVGLAAAALWWLSTLFSFEAALLFFICIAIHEYGHITAFNLFKIEHNGFIFIPFFGAGALMTGDYPHTWAAFVVAALGPVFGWVAGSALYVAYLLTGYEAALFAAFAVLIINGGNLLPIPPMDGSKMMAALLRSRSWIDGLMSKLSIVGMLLICYVIHIYFFLAVLALWILFSILKRANFFKMEDGVFYLLKTENASISIGGLGGSKDGKSDPQLGPMSRIEHYYAVGISLALIVGHVLLLWQILTVPGIKEIIQQYMLV